MRLIYQGTDITDSVDIVSAVHRDVSDGRCDCLELTLDHATAWYGWEPQTDDTIQLTENGYSTGTLYLNTIVPEGDSFRILATAGKSSTRRKAWASYADKTLEDIFKQCAAESGMESRLYGVEGKLAYPYLIRKNEGCAAFLLRLAHREGAVLKTVSGRYTAIGVLAAQELAAGATIALTAKQQGVTYTRRENTKYASLTVKTPYASATAYDEGAAQGESVILNDLPAMDNAAAGRWARGLLLMHNRRAEMLSIESEFNAGFTAMARIDIESGTDMRGEWLVDKVEHDFINRKSRAWFYRCSKTVV